MTFRDKGFRGPELKCSARYPPLEGCSSRGFQNSPLLARALHSGFDRECQFIFSARWGAVSFFALASAWNYLDRITLSAAAPRIKAEFHLNNADFGWLLSAFALPYAIAAPAVGWFLDRLGLETGIICAVALWSLSAALCGWTRSFGELVGARVFLGIWESAGVPAAGKLNAIYLEPKDRALGAAMTQIGIGIAGVAAPLLVAAFTGWRSPFFVCAALGFGWIPLWMLVRSRVRPYREVAPQEHAPFFDLLKDRRLIALAGANVLWMIGYTFWTNWTTLYLVQSYRLTTAQANSYAWFPPVASTLGGFAGGWLSRQFITRGTPAVEARVFATLISAFGCLVSVLAPFCPTPLWALIPCLCQLLHDCGGQRQYLHRAARYLGRRTSRFGHRGPGVRLWLDADGDLAFDRRSGRPVRLCTGLLAGGVASLRRMAIAQVTAKIGVFNYFLSGGWMAQITRRRSVAVNVGGVKVGGTNPIVVQSMTNTDTADVTSTVNQVMALARAGSELVRVTVNTDAAAAAVPKIVDTLNMFGVRVPIIGDFHYNGHLLLKKYPGLRPRAGEVPDQSGQRQHRQEARRQFPHDDRGGHRIRQAGAHRRELGLARRRAAHPNDG